ncbi:MAG: ATPase, partial [Gammaproteobacteria bacterium]
LVDEHADANDDYLAAAVAWGLSPPVLELTQARVRFLADGLPEAVGELALGRDANSAFERLLDLAQIHRPLAALVVDSQRYLSAAIKSLGLVHCLGPLPSADKSLAVQTLLRDEESDDDEEVSDIVRPCEEQGLVCRVLNDYQELYAFAEDGLRILAVNVKELQTILAGVDLFLKGYLKRTSADWPPFHCTVVVYSTSSSPMAMENRLTLWRDHVLERQREKGRPLVLSVGHRYAPKDQVIDLLKQEARLYDVAFLFHFLRSGMSGHADPARPFEFTFGGWSGVQFPIAEYPRPIRSADRDRRQSLLSNRRLLIQTCHANLSARLCYPGNANRNHVIYGQVEYKPWSGVVEALHQRAQWVACVDPFVDKRLLCAEGGNEQRKIVGFTSGLGSYGELNLTISTEQDTLKQLTDRVSGQLTKLLPFERPDGFEVMAARVVSEAEEVIGLASLRAVVGAHERIREVVGFAAIRRALAAPSGQMSQLLPLDSLLHWFAGSDVDHRPDLLQLTLEQRSDDIPLVHAVLVECKFAQQNPVHVAKAVEQVQDGLRHLTGLLAPDRGDLRRLGFDRRYWWAQLHRAITSRSEVQLPEQQWRELDQALESLAEGQFEIRWHGAIFTFWTNVAGPQPVVSLVALPAGTVEPPFTVPMD